VYGWSAVALGKTSRVARRSEGPKNRCRAALKRRFAGTCKRQWTATAISVGGAGGLALTDEDAAWLRLLTDQPRGDVGGAAGRKSDDDAHRPPRKSEGRARRLGPFFASADR